MSRQTQSHDTDDRDTKEARLQHPSGFLYLTQHESVPILIDALLDLPPGREFNKTELADHAGVTRQTVGAYIDVLIEMESSRRFRRHRPSATVSPRARSSRNCSHSTVR